jgi:predicted metal-dependent phosphoesterase TrpH
MLIDLQLHSIYSDGYLTPTQTAKFIAKQGVKVASLTDHNTVGGLDEFRDACRKNKIKAITGMELYVTFRSKRMNLLWYNFKEKSPELHDILRKTQQRRRHQVRNMLKKFEKNGFKLNSDKILDKYQHYVPINHVIDRLTENKRNLNKIKKDTQLKSPRIEDIISYYFRSKRYGILRETYINIERIFKLRKKIGGQLILCHPAKFNYIKINNWKRLKKLGLDGVEVLSPHHSVGAIMYIQQLARELDFVETGGSDFHRVEGNKYPLQFSWQYFKVDSRYLRKIKKIIG